MVKEKITEHFAEIEEQKRQYSSYKKLPNILLWTLLISGMIIGIIIDITFGGEGMGTIICGLIGAVAGGITYYTSRALISATIIQTECLAIIAKTVAKDKFSKEDLQLRWICKECGHENNPTAKVCFVCGKQKS